MTQTNCVAISAAQSSKRGMECRPFLTVKPLYKAVKKERTDVHPAKYTVTVLHGTGEPSRTISLQHKDSLANIKAKSKAYCDSKAHYVSQCSEVAKLSKDQPKQWIQVSRQC